MTAREQSNEASRAVHSVFIKRDVAYVMYVHINKLAILEGNCAKIMSITRRNKPKEDYDLGPVHLFREDLEAIADAVKEVGELRIVFDDNEEATDVADLKEMPEEPKKVTILAQERGGDAKYKIYSDNPLKVEFEKRKAYVRLVDPDNIATGVALRIQKICEPRRKRLRLYLRQYGGPTAMAGVGLVWLYAIILQSTEKGGHIVSPWNRTWPGLVVLLTLLALVPTGLAARWAGRNPIRIINAPLADRPSYWKRTSDLWVIGVATAIIGAIIGFLLGKIT